MAKQKPKEQKYKAPDEVRILLNEQGTSGLKAYSGFVNEAYNSSLYWPTVAPLYSRLRKSPTMAMVARAFSSWARSVGPVIDLPDKPTDDDKKYKDFLLSDFENMEGGFGRYIETAVMRTPFDGWFVWDAPPALRDKSWVPPVRQGEDPDEWRSQEDDGLIGIRRLAARDNNSFVRWEFNTRKRVKGMWQQDYPQPQVMIPIDKLHGLHHTVGDPNNPEGVAGLEPVWRLERIQYGLQVIQGIGFEHAAGHLSVKKTADGELGTDDRNKIAEAAKNILSAQEGNYAYWPWGLDGEIIDTTFSAAGTILEAIKYYDILMLSVFMMQTIALNTLTNTGALASQVDSTQLGIFTFNSMLDGLASQYDEQIGKRLYEWNKDAFPDMQKRPKIKFSHVENTVAIATLGSFLQQVNGILPMDEQDYVAIRKKTGFLPENNPDMKDMLKQARAMDELKQIGQPEPGTGTQPAPGPQGKEPAQAKDPGAKDKTNDNKKNIR